MAGFYSKGPWFSVDKIYSSYYLPKREEQVDQEEEYLDKSQQPPSENEKYATPITKKSTFFLPTVRQNNKNSSSRTNVKCYIDQNFINLQMEACKILLSDVKYLLNIGFIRFFSSEEECGKVVGNRKGKHESSLLSVSEERIVIEKLGGGSNKSHNARTNKSTAKDIKNNNSAQSSLAENRIWKQMCQQKSIFHSFDTNNKAAAGCNSSCGYHNEVLPVIEHVNRILVEKWATNIVLKASKVEVVPSAMLRSTVKVVRLDLMELIGGHSKAIGNTIMSVMCLRLREAPTKSLRRACRLYLCATSGPGEMRNDGSNAWRSLPDEYAKFAQKIPLRTKTVSPPGSSWNTLSYPGKDWRLRLKSFCFTRAHTSLSIVEEFRHTTSKVLIGHEKENREIHDTSKHEHIQVFRSLGGFYQWELGVKIRENCDFLLELNDLLLYNERKRTRELKFDEDSENLRSRISDFPSSEKNVNTSQEINVDYHNLLSIAGRSKMVEDILLVNKDKCRLMISKIEQDVSTLLGTPFCDRPLSTLAGMSDGDIINDEKSNLKNECERILGVMVIILIYVLEFRKGAMNDAEATNLSSRPWLRHMSWEGCLSYVLWDLIPIMERRGYYNFAINALEVLLFGKRLEKQISLLIPESLVDANDLSFISRRARGKAFDRLIIDYTHFIRMKNDSNDCKTTLKAPGKNKTKRRKNNILECVTASELVAVLIKPLLAASVGSGNITFSGIRVLAKRLKRPLSHTLSGLPLYEVNELGHRLGCDEEEEQDMTKYSDWRPVTDSAVANSLNTDRNGVGRRCSYIGFEDDDEVNHIRSLNVEELAKEYYKQGIIPDFDNSSVKGGWAGYHDEGGNIRRLFRILSAEPLGMDWASKDRSNVSSLDNATIFLTPYQGAPFDLHVGAEKTRNGEERRGIFARSKEHIIKFLSTLSRLEGQDLSDFVYESIYNRVKYTKSINRSDTMLEYDIQHTRTLCMLAVGLGGEMLASIFRCLFFDYRHYSGGLPDLLLVRALYMASTDSDEIQEKLVDLGEWVGESFSETYLETEKAHQAAQILMDKDDDFLGCGKLGDSGVRATRFKRPSASYNSTNCAEILIPEKLRLIHQSRTIKVECMFVEVKSQNDRLDSRQEDWLNILDLHGNARVCKFEKPKNAKKKAKD